MGPASRGLWIPLPWAKADASKALGNKCNFLPEWRAQNVRAALLWKIISDGGMVTGQARPHGLLREVRGERPWTRPTQEFTSFLGHELGAALLHMKWELAHTWGLCRYLHRVLCPRGHPLGFHFSQKRTECFPAGDPLSASSSRHQLVPEKEPLSLSQP